ncbi:MAG: DUF3365 domain-containing protein [Candidatus Magnetominusculus sp. LBB02]|nr:DUF3365 domain-containing protein [Candidatus Magnetominusculus sp. LBB02]
MPLTLWTTLVLISLLCNLALIKRHALDIVNGQARAMFGLIEMTRLWNSQHGGVYVPVDETTLPNPYLDVEDREIMTINGKQYTLINPAYMTRQIGEIAKEHNRLLFHITSLKPIRPLNAPDEWETMALREFEATKKKERFELIETRSGSSFRYMSVLFVHEACMKCHSKQGYHVGDIRGGISITLKADDVIATIHTQRNVAAALHFAVFIVVSGLMLYALSRRRGHYLALQRIRDQQEALIEDRTAELRDSNNRLIEEVKRRQKTEQTLRESEMMMASITQSANEAIISANADGHIITWNKAAETIFGYADNEIVGENITILMPDRYKTLHTGGMSRFLIEGRPKIIGTTVEIYALKKDNTEFPIEISLSSWTVNDITFFSAIIRDITARKKMEAEISDKTKQLEALTHDLQRRVAEGIEKYQQQEQLLIQQSKMAAMGEMIGAIAHQWRQPLNAVGVLIQDMQDAQAFGELDKDYMDNSVEKAMEQIQFMSKTIDDFRTFFKPAKTKMPFNIKKSLEEILSIISAQLVNHQIIYKLVCRFDDADIDTDSDTPCGGITVLGYPNEFKHVIVNIINNAKDAIIERRGRGGLSFGEGKIIIEMSKEEKVAVVIRITDNGGGIPPKIRDKIFEPYFSTKGDSKGTGIGLYMSKVIIENNMGGRLCCEHIENGTTFVIELTK